jgi:hypothetical protein
MPGISKRRLSLSTSVNVIILTVALVTLRLQCTGGRVIEDLKNTQIDYAEWVREEKARKPILSLQSTGTQPAENGRVKCTFRLLNSGDATAENVLIRFILPEVLEPEGYKLTVFSLQMGVSCPQFFLSEETIGGKIIYFDKNPAMPYMCKLPITLSFKVPTGSEGWEDLGIPVESTVIHFNLYKGANTDSLPIQYCIDCASEGKGPLQSLKVPNPYKVSKDN